ncbi:MAG: DUF2894 domain-containing protein [Marinobacter sp.]|uniref:DUF2894 domain-containing protein n=1 Tax=Marinobacter sp. TaxID=50741 RepID=UPI00299DDCEF|nr:DUF2894 domain-containing protein [Marinobacter sp.]MDX1757160.1 DUF2894 domain-containing protein [Marinobacter sp.]
MNDACLPNAAQETIPEQLARLHQQGAHRFDPVRFQYLHSLARRLAESPRQQHRLPRALAAFQEQFEQARRQAADLIDDCASDLPHPHLVSLQQCLEQGDYRGVHRLARRFRARQRPSPLADLQERLLAQSAQPRGDEASSPQRPAPSPTLQPRRELRALSEVRAAQAQLSIEKRIANAIANTPDNAGPMNAHRLVTRAVTTMQRLSPDYLNRFVGYVDTLLALEQMARKG